MNECKPWEIHDVQLQKIINEEVNQDEIYNKYVNAVVDGDYSEALKLNQEIFQRVSKICSESEGNEEKQEQAKLRLELLAEPAKKIQLSISNPNYN